MASEALLVYDLSQGHDVYALIASATIGNTLGSVLNYILGLGGEKLLIRRRLISKDKIAKFSSIFKKYGAFTLLFSWLPIVGDLFTLAAGVAKYNYIYFLILVFIAKLSRYIALAYGYNAFIG